jgi:primosomal protein N' (replication factor Y)
MKLLRVALPVPLHRDFDYTSEEATGHDTGRLVRVTFGSRRLLGVVVSNPDQSEVPPASLLPIEAFVDELPRVPDDILALARFAADYYQFPLGMALQHAVPPRGRRESRQEAGPPTAYRLTEPGRTAIATLPARATLQRALGAQFTDGKSGSRETLLSALPTAAPLLRRWLALGWIAAAGPEERMPGAGESSLPPLSAAQQFAADAIGMAEGKYQPFLLRGVTGSGKTEVYLASASARIAQGLQVLMLVPEINLTPQLAGRIRKALPYARVALLHSHVSAVQRLAAWGAAADGTAQFVLGTRLAIFAPLPKLGLVVVDEENDLSYKQQDGLRYSARDLAVVRARLRDVPIVLGSATPAMETLWQVRRGRYESLALEERAGGGTRPAIRLIPQRGQRGRGGLTEPIVAALAKRLERGEQSLIFINRRGYSPSLLCAECAWAANCVRCSARLVVHLSEKCLRCHHCGHQESLPGACPVCGNQDLLPLGFGTQRLESALREQFSSARIARIDCRLDSPQGRMDGIAQSDSCRRTRHPDRHADDGEGA